MHLIAVKTVDVVTGSLVYHLRQFNNVDISTGEMQ